MNCPTCGTPNRERARNCSTCGSPISDAFECLSLAVGTRLGSYVIEGVLGQGGYGITYRARHEFLHRSAAIKELFPDGSVRITQQVTGGPTFRDLLSRFVDEARIMAGLPDMPNLATVYELIEANGTAYLVMELIDGVTVAKALLDDGPGGMDPERVVSILTQVGSALTIVHAAGLLHRDIKPDNILLTGTGAHERAVLIDFGSARPFAAQTSSMTQMVTRGYAPLEQYGGSMRFGPTLDVYGLAATGYHLLTGVAPSEAPDRAGVDPVVPAHIVRPSVDRRVSDAIVRGMAMIAADRFSSAEDFCRALRPTTRTAVRIGGIGSPGRRIRSALQRPRTQTAAVIVGLLAAAALLTLGVLTIGGSDGSPRQISSGDGITIHDEPNGGGVVLSWSRRTGAIASASTNSGAVSVWTPDDGVDIQSIVSDVPRIHSLAWSPADDWHLAVAATGSNWVRVWDTKAKRVVASFPQFDRGLGVLAWAPDGRRIATAPIKGHYIRIIDVRSGHVDATLRGNTPVSAIAWAPDGERLATASPGGGYVYIWDARTSKIVATLQGRDHGISALAWSPDGDELATASPRSPYIFVWDTKTSSTTATMQSEIDGLTALAWSPRGDRLATGSIAFQEIWVFDRRSARTVASITGNVGGVGSLEWAPDGRRIATGSAAGSQAWVYEPE